MPSLPYEKLESNETILFLRTQLKLSHWMDGCITGNAADHSQYGDITLARQSLAEEVTRDIDIIQHISKIK